MLPKKALGGGLSKFFGGDGVGVGGSCLDVVVSEDAQGEPQGSSIIARGDAHVGCLQGESTRPEDAAIIMKRLCRNLCSEASWLGMGKLFFRTDCQEYYVALCSKRRNLVDGNNYKEVKTIQGLIRSGAFA